jgi:recombination protein RecT
MADKNAVAAQQTTELTAGEKFSNHVLREFGSRVAGEINATDYQRQLIQGYFIGIDRALKTADENRIRKNENNTDKKYNNDLAISWNTINLQNLALDVVHYAKIGLDMMQPNHLTIIPFKNKKTGQYDVTFIKGYNGIQYMAEKYALDKPKNITTELVYSTDIFKPIKKNSGNNVESYEFEITSAFDRGNIVGGFGYIEFSDTTKNKLIIMTMKDIEKRKPKYAAAEFWGGTTTEWQNGKKVSIETDGWFEEMCLKTLKREVYSQKHIEIDPKKIDDNYQYMKSREMRFVEMETQAAIEENANKEEFIILEPIESNVVEEPKAKSEPVKTETAPDNPDWMVK